MLNCCLSQRFNIAQVNLRVKFLVLKLQYRCIHLVCAAKTVAYSYLADIAKTVLSNRGWQINQCLFIYNTHDLDTDLKLFSL